MSTTYHTVLRGIARCAGALRGDSVYGLETSYIVAPLTTAEIANGPYSLTMMKDTLLQAEEDFVNAIATTGQHPWRQFIRGLTAALAKNDPLPSVDSANKQIVGIFGAVYDSTDNTPLTQKPIDVIVRHNRNANNHYVTPVYHYQVDGGIIRHTRTNVILECCIYDRAAQLTALNANSAMLLPDVLEPALVARGASYLLGSTGDGPKHREYSDQAIMGIKAGNTSIVPRSIPLPVTEGRAG